jgi:predicted acylesterase/phospholipase RssA
MASCSVVPTSIFSRRPAAHRLIFPENVDAIRRSASAPPIFDPNIADMRRRNMCRSFGDSPREKSMLPFLLIDNT